MKNINNSVSISKGAFEQRILASDVPRTVATDSHRVNDYGMLTKAINQHLTKKKKKKTKTYANDYTHCQSLDKLQLLNSQKNQEIKRHIHEKARIYAENEELKHQASNPTYKEHELYLKISRLQEENKRFKLELQQKQEKHKEEIEKLKQQHKTELQAVRKMYNQRKVDYNSSNRVQYITDKPQPYTSNHFIEKTGLTQEPYYSSTSYQANSIQPATIPKMTYNTYNQANHSSNSYVYSNSLSPNSNNPHLNSPSNYNKVTYVNNPSPKKIESTVTTSNYTVGSPLYLSPNRTEDKKETNANFTKQNNFVRQGSPNSSFNTTSQTNAIRKPETMVYQATQISKPLYPQNIGKSSPRQIKPEIISYKSSQKGYTPSFGNVPRKEQIVSRTGLNINSPSISYGENDMQEIYKRYCISD